jgi:hypothetical protein
MRAGGIKSHLRPKKSQSLKRDKIRQARHGRVSLGLERDDNAPGETTEVRGGFARPFRRAWGDDPSLSRGSDDSGGRKVSFETKKVSKSQMRQDTPGETTEVSGLAGEGDQVFAMSSSARRKSGPASVCSRCRSPHGSEAGKGRKVSFETGSGLKSQSL